MRRSPRTTLLALLLAVLALAAAGCGGSQVPADEVPGSPVALTVPSDSDLGAAGSSADGSADASADDSTDPDATAGETDGAAADGTAEPAPAAPSGGTAAPEPQAVPEDTTGAAEPPPAGSAPEQFESFCEQNAGAC